MENWKNKGFTPIPNILINNPALPGCAYKTYNAIAERAFGKRYSIHTSQETLAKEIGICRRTLNYHLNILEALGLIKRFRLGRGMSNTTVLTLKMNIENTGSLTKAIDSELGGLSSLLIKREKLTMKEGLSLVSHRRRQQREVAQALKQAQDILRTRQGLT